MSFLFPSQTITFEAAIRDLSLGKPKSRASAAHALGDVDDPTEKRRAVEALITALEDDQFEVRAEACASLGDLGDLSAVPGLVKRLDDGHEPVRQNAAIALGTLRAADGFEPLVQALREGPADLRFQAATSLAEIDGRKAFDPLIAALGDKDPQVVGAAALALGAIPVSLADADLKTRARTALVEHLDDLDVASRFDVAYALADLDDPAGKTVLASALGDSERAWDAVTALARLGDRAALIRALPDQRVPTEATVLAAGRVLALAAPGEADPRATTGERDPRATTGERDPRATTWERDPRATTWERENDAAKRVLLAALTARKTHVRGLAVEQLTEVGGRWALAPLETMGKSGKNIELNEVIAGAIRAIEERGAK